MKTRHHSLVIASIAALAVSAHAAEFGYMDWAEIKELKTPVRAAMGAPAAGRQEFLRTHACAVTDTEAKKEVGSFDIGPGVGAFRVFRDLSIIAGLGFRDHAMEIRVMKTPEGSPSVQVIAAAETERGAKYLMLEIYSEKLRIACRLKNGGGS